MTFYNFIANYNYALKVKVVAARGHHEDVVEAQFEVDTIIASAFDHDDDHVAK